MSKLFWKTVLGSLVIAHATLVVANLLAIFILPFTTPWYVAAPLISFIVNLTFTPVSCPLTKLENKIRKKMGLPEIRFFVAHYFLRRIRGNHNV